MKRFPRIKNTGVRIHSKSYGDNGNVAFRTKAEKEEMEREHAESLADCIVKRLRK